MTPTLIQSKLRSLLAGNREIVNDTFLDTVSQTDYGSEIRTARNRNRCGLQDAYVAWIRDEARPHDLEFTPDMFAVASI